MVSVNVLRFTALERLLVCAATVAASVGCATRSAPRWPSPPVGAARAPLDVAHVAPPLALGAARRPADADALPSCTIEGVPRVVAAKAAPPAGVVADADSSQVWLRFAEKANTRVVMALNPKSLEVLAASDSPPSILEDAKHMALSAWHKAVFAPETHGRTSIERATDNLRSWAAGSEQAREPLAVSARVDSNRSVLAWTEGSIYEALDVRILTVDSDGEPLGQPVTIPHDGSAIGQPAVAVASSGRGVVAFLDSNDHGFQLVAVSLDCTSPAVLDAPPAWANRIAP